MSEWYATTEWTIEHDISGDEQLKATITVNEGMSISVISDSKQCTGQNHLYIVLR